MGTHHEAETAIVELSFGGESEFLNGLYEKKKGVDCVSLYNVYLMDLCYLADVYYPVFAAVNVNERIARLLCPCFHYPGNIHPPRNGVRSTGFLIDEIP